MSADRGKVYETNALTPLELMKARGATPAEIRAYLKKREQGLFRSKGR